MSGTFNISGLSRIVANVLVATALIFGSSCGGQKKDGFKIGAILPLTGDAASYGQECRQGMEVASIAWATRMSGLRVSYEDSKADPKQAVAAFNKLVGVDRVDAIIGDMFSSTTLAIAGMSQQKGLVLLSPTAADERIPETGDKIFTIYPPAAQEGHFMADSLGETALSRVVVLYQNQAATKTIADAFSSGVTKRGGTVLLVETISEEKTSYRSVMDKIAALKPSCVYLSAYRDPVANLIVQGRELGISTIYASQSTLYDAKALEDYAGKLDGVLVSGPFFDENNTALTGATADFANEYNRRYGKKPSVWAAYGYDALNILLQAHNDAVNDDKFLNQTLPGKDWPGLTGTTSIAPDRSVRKQMILYRINGNKFVRE